MIAQAIVFICSARHRPLVNVLAEHLLCAYMIHDGLAWENSSGKKR